MLAAAGIAAAVSNALSSAILSRSLVVVQQQIIPSVIFVKSPPSTTHPALTIAITIAFNITITITITINIISSFVNISITQRLLRPAPRDVRHLQQQSHNHAACGISTPRYSCRTLAPSA